VALRLATTSPRALGLYGVLLVLPTLIFGGLYWREIQKDFARERLEVPSRAESGAERIVASMRQALGQLIERESQRPFYSYSQYVAPPTARGDAMALQRSSLLTGPNPTGIQGWFSIDRSGGPDSQVRVFLGTNVKDSARSEDELRDVVADFRKRKETEEFLQRATDLLLNMNTVEVPLTALAVGISTDDQQIDCVEKHADLLQEQKVKVQVSEFRLQFYVHEGTPRAIASRRVLLNDPLSAKELPEGPCFEPLMTFFHLQQGFLIDPDWLLRKLPFSLANQALDEEEELRIPPQAGPIDYVGQAFASIYPINELGFETYYPEDGLYGQLDVLASSERMTERHSRQSQRFLAVGGMLLLTLATGVTLLYRGVRRELDQAHRMQNFVAAVTHELRTPVSTIRLHAEMLQDGWVQPEKQPEYYRRIVRETQRLSTLVERVLEKSRLKENVTRPVAADLNETIQALRPALSSSEDEDDLDFQLEAGLPAVWLTAEGIEMILSNLVENARKYAPPGGEPLVVRTRWKDGRVLLEVLDRGPGVPAAEREKIFDAFYRVGSEQTRTTTGTGLGLHLVRLHAETCGARVSVEDREGGGSAFQVAFRPAD
jgi:signal transduction histidine kinase